MKALFAAGILGIVIIFSGCTQQQPAPAPGYDSYLPLIESRIITYEATSYQDIATAGTLASAVTTETWQETWQYVGDVSLTDTLEVFKINVIRGGSTTPYYYREDDTGAYKYGYGSSPTTEVEIMFIYPLVVGATWESDSWPEPNEVDREEDLTTGAGTFNCKVITYPTFPGVYHYLWVAKDIGIIKERAGYGGVGTSWTSREIISKNF